MDRLKTAKATAGFTVAWNNTAIPNYPSARPQTVFLGKHLEASGKHLEASERHLRGIHRRFSPLAKWMSVGTLLG